MAAVRRASGRTCCARRTAVGSRERSSRWKGGEGAEVVVLEPERGAERRIPLAAVKEARLAFHL